MSSKAYEPVRKLAASDAVEFFDCGQSALNQFLQRFAPARLWYLNWEFEPGPFDPFHLFLLMKDIKAMVGKS